MPLTPTLSPQDTPRCRRRGDPVAGRGRSWTTFSILITGFGPFPGAPFNPTEVLAQELAQRRHPAFINVRRAFHVFTVSYDAVDREMPALLESHRPDALIMFGLALRTKHVRIETLARNVLARACLMSRASFPVQHNSCGRAARPHVAHAGAAPAHGRAIDGTAGGSRAIRPSPLQLSVPARRRGPHAARRGTSFIHVPHIHRTHIILRGGRASHLMTSQGSARPSCGRSFRGALRRRA